MSERDKPQSSPENDTHADRAGGQAAGAAPPSSGTVEREPVPGDVVGVEDFLPMAIPASERRVRGRPQGSVNVRTNKTFQAAVSRYGDPLIASIAWGNMSTKALITELRSIASDCGLKLGATVMDVVRFQEECRRNAMPFGHAKRAAVDEKGDTALPTFLGVGRVEVKEGGKVVFQGRSIEDAIDVTPSVEHQTNQPDSEARNDKSHDE